MARLESFPDRFTLDRYARELRRQALDRLVRRTARLLRRLAQRVHAAAPPRAPQRTLRPQ